MSDKQNTNTLLPSSNQILFHNLFDYNKGRTFFSVKKPGYGKRYPELELFRQQIEIERRGAYQQPYSNVKKKVFTYKSIFTALGLLFLFLGIIIFMKAVFWSFGRFSYNEFFIAKNLACAFCAFTGFSSLWIARTMRTEIEAANQLLRRGRYKLSKAFTRKKIEHGLKGLFAFWNKYQKSLAIKHHYVETQDKLLHHYEDLKHLFERFERAGTLNSQTREHLYNQALLEFEDKINHVISIFKESSVK